MGLFWDLIQQGQISQASDRTEGIERRLDRLERELRRTNEVLLSLLGALERRFGEDLDRDGRVG